MAHVIVHVNGRPYTMQCPAGEEDHLRELAELLDAEVARVKTSVGNVGDIRLLVMAGLMVADRLSEAIRRIETLEEQVVGLRESRNESLTIVRTLEDKFSERLESASKRLEVLAHEMTRER
jgi:cell division protein ZapA